MGDRYNIFSQMEHLQSKYNGTGHADLTKWEWMVHTHRDSYARFSPSKINQLIFVFSSYIGHGDLLSHIAICENESRARVQVKKYQKKPVYQPESGFLEELSKKAA